jgi:hypothetical protein
MPVNFIRFDKVTYSELPRLAELGRTGLTSPDVELAIPGRFFDEWHPWRRVVRHWLLEELPRPLEVLPDRDGASVLFWVQLVLNQEPVITPDLIAVGPDDESAGCEAIVAWIFSQTCKLPPEFLAPGIDEERGQRPEARD